jgi:hypothetical protein
MRGREVGEGVGARFWAAEEGPLAGAGAASERGLWTKQVQLSDIKCTVMKYTQQKWAERHPTRSCEQLF